MEPFYLLLSISICIYSGYNAEAGGQDLPGYVFTRGNCYTSTSDQAHTIKTDQPYVCAEFCNLDTKCAGFLYSTDNFCIFKNELCLDTGFSIWGNSGKSSPNNGFYAKVSYMAPKGFVAREGDCPGNDIQNLKFVSVQECANRCQRSSICKAFMMWKRHVCFLKYKSCASPTTADPDNIFFIKLDETNKCLSFKERYENRIGLCDDPKNRHKGHFRIPRNSHERHLIDVGDDMNAIRQRGMEELDRDTLNTVRMQFGGFTFGQYHHEVSYAPRTHGECSSSSNLHVEDYLLRNVTDILASNGNSVEGAIGNCVRRLVLFTENSPCRNCLRVISNWARGRREILVEVGYRMYFSSQWHPETGYHRANPGGRDGQRLDFEDELRRVNPPANVDFFEFDTVDENGNLWKVKKVIKGKDYGGEGTSDRKGKGKCYGAGCGDELRK